MYLYGVSRCSNTHKVARILFGFFAIFALLVVVVFGLAVCRVLSVDHLVVIL